MSEEQFKAFLEKIKGDAGLQERLKVAQSPQHIVEIAKDHGHDLSLDTSELGEDELDDRWYGFTCVVRPHNNTHG